MDWDDCMQRADWGKNRVDLVFAKAGDVVYRALSDYSLAKRYYQDEIDSLIYVFLMKELFVLADVGRIINYENILNNEVVETAA